ncbi:MAG: DUF721 domain-containing protein [Acidobacteriota bacterium]
MDGIIKLLPSLVRLAQNNEDVCESASFVAWRMAVGEAIARISLPIRLNRKTLVVAVIDETWQRQLEQISGQILFKLNTLLGSAVVTGVEFSVDPSVVPLTQSQKAVLIPSPPTPDPVLEQCAEQIADTDLRARFLKAASRYLQAQQVHDKSD